ncbi:MAG: AAC(3) family N-acetyltransferase, partial [Candidatus Hydrogenedentota bacterium]
MVTARKIVADLHSLGLDKGVNIVVHSSLSSLGHVEDGADAVIAALLEVIGETGTLVMPTFTFPPEPAFDVDSTRSTTGLLTETFRKREGVYRSAHPTHSVAAFGPLAKHF